MSFRILKHTADLRLKVSGKTVPDLFTEALKAVAKTLNPKTKGRPSEIKKHIQVKSPSQTSLLVDFLNEALTLSQINKEIYLKAYFVKISETEVEAVLEGIKVSDFKEDIKAVTHHEARIVKNAKGNWETILVLDI